MERDLFYYDLQDAQQHELPPERPQEPSREPSDQTIQAKGASTEDAAHHDWPFRIRYSLEQRKSHARQSSVGQPFGSQDDYDVPYEIYNNEDAPIWSSYPSDDETGSLDWDSSFDPFTSSTFRRGSIILDSSAATPSLAPSPSSPSLNPAAVKLKSSTDALREFGKKFLSRAAKHSSRKSSGKDEASAQGSSDRHRGHRSRHSGGSSTTNTNPSVGRTRSNTVDSVVSRMSASASASATLKSPIQSMNALGLGLALPIDDEEEDEAPLQAPTPIHTDLTAPSSPSLPPALQSPLQQQASEGYFKPQSSTLLPSLIRDEIFPESTFLHTEASIATPSLPSPSLESPDASQHLHPPAPLPENAVPKSPGMSVYHTEGEPGLAELMQQMQEEDAAFEATERSMTTIGWSSEAEINELRRRRRDNQAEWQAKVEKVLDESEEVQQQQQQHQHQQQAAVEEVAPIHSLAPVEVIEGQAF